jgi:hypothetical protein
MLGGGGGLKTYIAHNTMATSPGSLPGKVKAIFSVRSQELSPPKKRPETPRTKATAIPAL